jgi:ribonuclease BN (tRNA processing enzyme)
LTKRRLTAGHRGIIFSATASNEEIDPMRPFLIVIAALPLTILVLSFAAAQPPDGRQPRAAPEELIRRFDRNGDGRISRDEAPPRMLEHWDDIDTNHDGYVTLAELKARETRVAAAEGGGQRGPAGVPGGAAGMARRGAGAGSMTARFQPTSTFSVITLGTGSPQYDPKRSGPSALVQHRGHYYLVDMGNGTQARLQELGITVRQVDALLLTHHHLDHNEEFMPLFMQTRLSGGKPDIVGPPGTAKLADFTREFYADDIAYRMRRRGRSPDEFGRPSVREIQGGESFRIGDMEVKTARVNHSIHTVAYRFEADGRSIVISGDLSYTEALVALAHNADVLVIDSGGAIVHEGQVGGGQRGRTRPEGQARGQGESDAQRAHSSAQEVIDMARKSGAKRLVLVHIAPGEVDEQATIRAIGQNYPGEVIVGQDLLEIPAAGKTSARTHHAPRDEVPHAEREEYTGKARVSVRTDGSGDGKSWATALGNLQDAVDAASKLGGGEVWAAEGVYRPATDGNRDATFQLRSGVAADEGFAGDETKRDRSA